jgi:putative transposon-encoded protein
MSFIKPIDLRHLNIREAIQAVISGRVERIEFSETVNLKLKHDGKQAVLTITDGAVEIDIPGPISPDVLRVTAFGDHAMVDLRLSQVRIDY